MQIPLELVEQFAKGNGVAFVGMELSVDAGLPGREQLQALLCRELESIPTTLSFPDTAQCYVNEYGRVRLVSRLREEFDTRSINPTAAHSSIAKLPITYIFTTNYDNLLEETLATLKQPYDLLVNNAHFGFWSKDRLQLIKLHGDLRQPDSTVVTAQDYEEYSDKHAALTRTLGVALQSSTVLFLGYLGLEDPNFRQLLTQVRNESGELARNAFTVLFNANKWVIDELKRRGIRVINLEIDSTSNSSRAMYEKRNQRLSAWLDEFNQQIQSCIQAATRKTKVAASSDRKLPFEPYKFLDFFTSADSEIFHGRRQEAEWLVGLILSSRLTVLYGESGTGKTSLLQAAVMLHPQLSEYRIAYTRPLSDTLHEIRDELCKVLPVVHSPAQVERQNLCEIVESRLPVGERLLLILDQFEELFIRQGTESRQKFIHELIRLLSLSQHEVRCVLSLRSDYLDRLDELELSLGRDPLRHRMRIYNLGPAEASAAIMLPAKDFGISIEPALLDQLLSDLTQSDVAPPQLQIVCYELWQDWQTHQSDHGWTLQRYMELGGTGAILTGYLDRVIAELDKPEVRHKFGLDLDADKAQEAARAILKGMISAERTKIATSRRELTQNELVNRTGINAGQTRILLNYLANRRIIRRLFDSDRYELAHEVMIEKVWQWVNEEERQLLELRDLLARATSDYVKFKSLLPLDRLILLTEQAATLTPDKASSELLLLSAIEHNLDPTIWVRKMEVEQAIELLSNLLPTAKYTQLPQIAKALGAINSPKALRYLQELLQHQYDDAQRAAVKSIINLRSFGVAPMIYRAVQREEKLGRIVPLIDALEQIRSDEAVTMLFALASDHPNPHVCSRAANALLRLNQPLDVHFLFMQIENGDTEIQQGALLALRHIVEHDLSSVQTILNDDKEPRLQFVAIRALARLEDQNMCNLLISTLSAKETYVRAEAVRTLGQLGNYRVVKPLLALLNDTSADVRAAVVMALGQLGDDRALAPLLALLNDPNSETRLSAIRALGQVWKLPELVKLGSSKVYERVEAATALGQLGDERALEPLLALLNDGSAGVRIATAMALGQLGDKALAPLLALLSNPSADIRTAAAMALGQLGDKALAPLLALLSNPSADVRIATAMALGQLGDDRALAPLLALLNDPNSETHLSAIRALGQVWKLPELVKLGSSKVYERVEAATALGQLGDERALEPLLALLNDGSAGVRIATAMALGQLGDKALEPLLALLSNPSADIRTAAAMALGQLGDKALAPLLALLSNPSADVRIATAMALGQLGDDRALAPLLVLLNDTSGDVRAAVATALGQLGDERALEPLLALLNDGSAGVRIATAMALGQLGDKALEPLLALLSNPSADVRAAVATALGQLGDERALEPLLALLNDPNSETRLSAIRALGQVWKLPELVKLGSSKVYERVEAATALGQLGDERALEPLLALLNDTSGDVRAAVATALGQLGDKALAPLLALLNDGSAGVRIATAMALGQLGDERAVEPLLVLLNDTSAGARIATATALIQLGDERAVELLLALLNDASAGARIATVTALIQLGDERAVKPLLALLDDASAGVRIAAARALGQLGDERALEPLLVLQKDQHSVVRTTATTALKELNAKAIPKK